MLWNDLDQNQIRARRQLGLAWRQTDGSVWNSLARLERTFERLSVATIGTEKRAVTLGSAHASWRPTDHLSISGRWASKWATDSTGGAPEAASWACALA